MAPYYNLVPVRLMEEPGEVGTMEQGALLEDLDVELPPSEHARRREATTGCCLVLGVVVLSVQRI